MDYYIINILCDICLLHVIRQFLGDFFEFDLNNRINREVLSCCWLAGTIIVNEWLHITVVNLIVNILLILLVSCVYEGSIFKKCLACLMIAVITAACDMLAFVVTTPFLDNADYYYSYVFTVILALIFERILGITIRKERIWDIVGREMLALSGFPIMAAVILYCVTAMLSGIYRLIACICVVGISALSIDLYNSLARNLEDRMRKTNLEREIEAYKNELELMRISSRREENLRHDLRHHLFEIEGLAKQGKDGDICSYINELRKTFVDSKQIVHTGEYETDSLINYLIDNAKSHQIQIEYDIKIPEDIDISRCKLNIIVGNLLENAIDAASKAEKKKIMFTMRFSGGVLFLQIKNTFEGNIRIEDGRIIGKKSVNNHGIGLRSVQDLVKIQNGEMNISVENELFIIEGIIPLE